MAPSRKGRVAGCSCRGSDRFGSAGFEGLKERGCISGRARKIRTCPHSKSIR